jgi:hypothetical protein
MLGLCKKEGERRIEHGETEQYRAKYAAKYGCSASQKETNSAHNGSQNTPQLRLM